MRGMDALGGEVLALLNRCRASPALLLPELQAMRAAFNGRLYRPPGGGEDVLTEEGPAAVEGALAFLRAQPALPSLRACPVLQTAAEGLAEHLCLRGLTVPAAAELLPEHRLPRAAPEQGCLGESLAFGWDSPVAVLLHLLVDDGLPARPNRRNCFSAMFTRVGAAAGAHPRFGACCVLSFAGKTSRRVEGLAAFEFDPPALAVGVRLVRAELTSNAQTGAHVLHYTLREEDGALSREAAPCHPRCAL